MATFNVTIPDPIAETIEMIAGEMGKPTQTLIQEALAEHFGLKSREVEKIERGLKDLREGRFITQEDLKRKLEDRLDQVVARS